MAKKKTHEQYVEEVKNINPNIKVIERYNGVNTKILHKCLLDDYEWQATPHNILKGRSCPKCSKHIKRTQDMYKKELSIINPNIEVIGEYITNVTPILHKCIIHNIKWNATPSNILCGHGCRKCANEILANSKVKSKKQYIEDVRKINPNILVIGNYVNAHTQIKHKCLIDGYEWNAKPNNILCGNGCPICNESYGERRIRLWLEKYNFAYEYQKIFKNCRNLKVLPFDFYLYDYNVAIEYQGEQHYKPIEYFGGEENFKKQQKRDNIKRNYCKNNKIKLLEIPYYKNIEEELNNFLFI